jgi:hypothetical protein
MTVWGSALWADRPSIIQLNTPISPQRFQRLYNVLCGPYSFGVSRQRSPFRLTKMIPLSTRRSSTRGLPWLLGKYGDKRDI